MKNLNSYLISFLSFVTLLGLFYLGFFEDIVRISHQIDIMDKIDQCCQHRYFKATFRYFITLFGAMALQIFALFRNFNGAETFLKKFFPGKRSETFYNRADFCICVIIGSIIGFIFFNPQNAMEALAAGFSWQGAITVMMTKGEVS